MQHSSTFCNIVPLFHSSPDHCCEIDHEITPSNCLRATGQVGGKAFANMVCVVVTSNPINVSGGILVVQPPVDPAWKALERHFVATIEERCGFHFLRWQNAEERGVEVVICTSSIPTAADGWDSLVGSSGGFHQGPKFKQSAGSACFADIW